MQYQNCLKILCMKYRGRKKNILTVLKLVRYGKFVSQFTEIFHLKVMVPPWVIYPQVGYDLQMRS